MLPRGHSRYRPFRDRAAADAGRGQGHLHDHRLQGVLARHDGLRGLRWGETMSADEQGWEKAANRSDLAEGEVLGVLVSGHEIALYDLDGEIHATDDICTHAYAKLSDGW